ncbi:DNA-binding protein [Streptomyces sp. NBC_00490]|uniref:DNA-binding protein n=1 Tax=Streptomyces sp. NBC_00490 TaxID=2903657 RepID=UPI002E16D548
MGNEDLEASTRSHLFSLASGAISPEEASEWALRVMDSDAPELQDERIWTALDRLSGADLMEGPGQYLHGKEDFESWVTEFGSDG